MAALKKSTVIIHLNKQDLKEILFWGIKKVRQNGVTNKEKDFCKFMNNANYGYDCRNNVNNSTFETIIDEVNKISYIKK